MIASGIPASCQAATWCGSGGSAPLYSEARETIAGVTVSTAWPFGELTDTQRLANAKLEAAQRAGTLRGLPSCFGGLS